MAEFPRPFPEGPPAPQPKPEAPKVRLQKYRTAVHDEWTRPYHDWLSANLRAELAQVMIGSGLSAGAIALLAFLFWRETLPPSLSLKEAVVGALLLGVAGGLATLFARVVWISASRRLLAPFRLWDTAQETIAKKDAALKELGDLLFDFSQDEPLTPSWIVFEKVEDSPPILGVGPTLRVYHFNIPEPLKEAAYSAQDLRVTCSGWLFSVPITVVVEPAPTPLVVAEGGHVPIRITPMRHGERSFDFEYPSLLDPARLKISLETTSVLRIKWIRYAWDT